jgi:hypothetical protein
VSRPLRARAREAYASAIARRGKAWRNLADNIRAGFENVWITPALDALEGTLRLVPDAAEDEADTEALRA